jgi:pyruvate dehydrogenase E1 component alpha subunit
MQASLKSGMTKGAYAPRTPSARPVMARRALKVTAVAAVPKTTAVAKYNVSAEAAKDLYYDMTLGREFEEMCAQMYYRGKMFGFVHLYSGQEAVSSGVIRLLRQDDSVGSTYRDHVHALSKNVPAREIMAELFGKKTGCCRGQGGSMHMFSSKYNFLGGYAFIGEGIPVGLGAAFAAQYKKNVLGNDASDSVTCSFFGDGTCNVGQFYECLNMAALYKLPHIFVVENNKWAIGMSHNRATAPTAGDMDPQIYKKGPPFGMPGVLVDGMDVLKVREVAMEAIARARRGDGPTLIECETYRYRGHSLADPDELRSKDEKAVYAARDPIPQLKAYMLQNGLATEAEIKDIEKKVADIVEDSVQFAEESPKPERAGA